MWPFLWRNYWTIRNRWQTQSIAARFLTTFLILSVSAGIWVGYRQLTHFFTEELTVALWGQVALICIELFFLSTVVVGWNDTFHAIYQGSDLELLRVAPISPTVIFTIKLLASGKLSVLPFFTGIVVFMAYGKATNSGAHFYLWIGAILSGLVLMAANLKMIGVLLMRWLFNPRHARGIALSTLSLIVLITFSCQWLLYAANDELFARLILPRNLIQLRALTIKPGLPITLLSSGVFLTLLNNYLYNRIFYFGWANLQEVSSQPAIAQGKRHPVERLAHRLPNVTPRLLIAKEWLIWVRAPRQLISLALPLSLVLLLPLYLSQNSLLRVLFWIYLIAVFIQGLIGVMIWTTRVLAYEGRNLELLKFSPMGIREMLWGKFWSVILPAFISVELITLGVGVITRLSWDLLLATFLITAYLVLGLTAAGIAVGGLAVDLQQRDNAPYLVRWWGLPATLTISLLLIIPVLLKGFWSVNYLIPETELPMWWMGLQRALLNQSFWTVVSITGGEAVFWLLVVLGWRAGRQRLERGEM